MAYETIIVEVENHIALIKLNRPDALNALNADLLTELVDALEFAQKNEMVRCIVITGSEKAFAAGADIKMMSSKSFSDVFNENLFGEESDRIGRIRKPIIAAVSGYALGGGCELAMMCDFIIAADNAKFGQPEINLGVIAGMGGSQRMTRYIGKSKSMDMNLTGRFMEADEAERCGLVSRVVPTKKLIDEAMGAAAKIAEEGILTKMVDERYSSYDEGIGAKIESGECTFEDLEAFIKAEGKPAKTSGKQETYEMLFNRYA